MAIAFNADLAAVGGPYTTISDTGFQTQPFSQADCNYVNSIISGACTGPPPPGVSQYEFTYQLGPETINGNIYTSLVNFEIFSRDVTEQLVATPEPATVLPLGVVLLVLVLITWRKHSCRVGTVDARCSAPNLSFFRRLAAAKQPPAPQSADLHAET